MGRKKKIRFCKICKETLTDKDKGNVVLMGSGRPYYPDAFHETCFMNEARRIIKIWKERGEL